MVFLGDTVCREGLDDAGVYCIPAERKAVASGFCSRCSCRMYDGMVRAE